MATLQIENLPEELYDHIQSFASEQNVTLNEAVIHILKQAFQPSEVEKIQDGQLKPMAEILEKIRRRPRVNPLNFGLPDSTVLIREDRDR